MPQIIHFYARPQSELVPAYEALKATLKDLARGRTYLAAIRDPLEHIIFGMLYPDIVGQVAPGSIVWFFQREFYAWRPKSFANEEDEGDIDDSFIWNGARILLRNIEDSYWDPNASIPCTDPAIVRNLGTECVQHECGTGSLFTCWDDTQD